MNGRVIGGPHHGEFHSIGEWRHGDLFQLPVYQAALSRVIVVDGRIDGSALLHAASMRHEIASYRLAVFCNKDNRYEVWIPSSVPKDQEMEHVLKLALKAPSHASKR